MTEFRYVRASEWGLVWARPPVAEKLLDGETFVHHTAGNHHDDAFTAFRAQNAYAIAPKPNGKGYSALDYDVLVHRNPVTGVVTIGEGRGPWMSAATQDRNEQGEAVCLLGYFHPNHKLSRHPHPDEIEGVARGIVWGMVHGWIALDTKIMGHRDNPAHPGNTGCPGDYLQAELPTIRRRVAELLAPVKPAPPAPEVGGEDVAELFTLQDDPITVFERVGPLVRWISPEIWAAMDRPADRIRRGVPLSESKTFTFLGPRPTNPHDLSKFGAH